jgi:glutathionylspermidine synthase
MQRIPSDPRPNYQERIESVCLLWHDRDDYWSERAYYRLSRDEVNQLERATNELHARCLDVVQHVIDRRLYEKLGIPQQAIPLIEKSWNDDWPSVYGRFDLAYNGVDEPLLLEYNADTPTALLEASVVQWYWLEDLFPKADQFNSIHEKLVAKWKELIPYLPGGQVHFAAVEDIEERVTVTYLADTAVQAGLKTTLLRLEEIGYSGDLKEFVGENNEPIQNIFKLYPWEWMANEPFFEYLKTSKANWIEPPWKMILSNKAMLAILYDLFPGHRNLLEARLDGPGDMAQYVRKPFWGREGEGVEIRTGSEPAEPHCVYQKFARPVSFAERYPIVGSWVIGGEAAGIGIRESNGPITNNLSQFVPHLFE